NKAKFLTYVIASGVTYGEENDIFHYFFKAGWLNKESLDVIGTGNNIVPSIHVKDLASIVHQVLCTCPTIHYILAVDNGNNTLLEIVKEISKVLTTGKIRHVTAEELIREDKLTLTQIDSLTLDLRLEARFVHDNLNFTWICPSGMTESMQTLVKEYKLARGLLPIRVCILGPPLSGKTKLARLLSEYYSVPHIHIKGVIDAKIRQLEEKTAKKVRKPVSEDVNDNGAEVTDDAGDMIDDEEFDPFELLEQIKETLSSEKGRLSNALVCSFLKKKLNSKECSNQGYILDGFPKTKAQAELLFGGELICKTRSCLEKFDGDDEINDDEGNDDAEKEVEAEQSTENTPLREESAARELNIPDMTAETKFLGKVSHSPSPDSLPKGILPACTIFLQATDKFLFARVMRLTSEEVKNTHNDEENFIRRLLTYRAAHAGSEVAALMANNELRKGLDEEMLQKITGGESGNLAPTEQIASMMAGSIDKNSLYAFFEDKGVPVFNFDVAKDHSGNFVEIMRKIGIAIGPPRNYGPNAFKYQTEPELARQSRELELQRLEKARVSEEYRRREARKNELSEILKQVRKEEDEALLKASKPLREFLAKFVMPTLTKGIFECIWRRPEDPVDFLAEYLFRNNIQVD
ncbi:unnamed protein product, partial [Mesocestoides corti]